MLRWLRRLAGDGRALSDDEQDEFIHVWSKATMGVGGRPAVVEYPGGKLRFDNIEYMALWLSDQRDDVVVVRNNLGEEVELGIGYLWARLKDYFFRTQADALQLATKISAEREKKVESKPYEF